MCVGLQQLRQRKKKRGGVMRSDQWSVLLVLAVIAGSGCGSRPETETPVAPTAPVKKPNAPDKKPVDQAKSTELVGKVEALRKKRADLEQVYERQVLARHSEWTPEKQKAQLAVLRLKWEGCNRTNEEDTVREMRTFGIRIWHSELSDDDYRDIHKAKSAGWLISDEIKALNEQIERLKGAASDGGLPS